MAWRSYFWKGSQLHVLSELELGNSSYFSYGNQYEDLAQELT